MATDHVLGSGILPSFRGASGLMISNVPANATVSFVVSSPSNDTFNVGIFTPPDWNTYMAGGAGARAYAFHMNVR